MIRIITKSKCNDRDLLIKFLGLRYENWLDITALECGSIKLYDDMRR